MKISDFKDIFNPMYMEAVEQIIKKRGICRKINSVTCPFSILNSNDSKYCVSNSFDKVRYAKSFKQMVEEEKNRLEEEKVEEFKVGDKVKYINKENVWFGKIGKVISVYVSTCFVNFDDEIVECYKENLEKIEDSKVLGCVRIDINDCIDWEATRKLNEIKEGQKEELYVIWNPKGKNPHYKHTSLEDAEKEAERLAKENPNQEFYVLKAISKAKGTVKVEWE